MAKKNLTENQNETHESVPEETKPVKTGRKIFKDSQAPEVYADADTSSATVPVKVKAAKPKAAELNSSTTLDDSNQTSAVDKPVKVRRAKWVWLGILIMLVFTAVGASIGYGSALQARMAAETNQRLELATTSFIKAERDIANGDLQMASQRLQYIMTIYPAYPGLEDKLKEVLTAIALANPDASAAPQPTPDVAFTPVPTKDTSQVSVLLPQAQNQFNSNDWKGLLDTINQMRNIDPSYEALTVDGLYFYALRNNGLAKINAGHLEVGLYYLAMAASIAPLDQDALSLASLARMYLNAESFFGIDYYKSTELLAEVAKQVPHMVDVSGVTAKQRYVESMVGIGDVLMKALDYCNAATQYETARNILSTDELLAKLQQAQEYCANPPATPTPTLDPNAPTPTPTPDSYQPTD
jgi:tetratricopeptide (TPR) repeat protein